VSSLLEQTRAMVRRPLQVAVRPRLTIVPRLASRAPRVPFVALVVVVLTTGLVGLLLLNTGLQRGAYQVSALQTRADGLALREQQLQREVSNLSQPQRIAREAVRMGMVANVSPAFLDLRTRRTLGRVHVATAADRFLLAPLQGAAASRHQAKRSVVHSESAYDRALAHEHWLSQQVAAAKVAAEKRAAEQAARAKAARAKAARQKAARERAARQKAARHGAAQRRSAQHRSAQHRPGQHRTGQHRPGQHRPAQHRSGTGQ
jgi:hypothetical protein